MATDDSDALDNKLAKFATYEEYLDDRVFDRDRYFLEDEDLARQLSEYGFLPAAPERMDETLKREEFEAQKRVRMAAVHGARCSLRRHYAGPAGGLPSGWNSSLTRPHSSPSSRSISDRRVRRPDWPSSACSRRFWPAGVKTCLRHRFLLPCTTARSGSGTAS